MLPRLQERKMPGGKKSNIRDVAAYAGVAASTVSRVLNGREADRHTSEETRKKILSAAKELNYTPNINARRLFSQKSNVIGLVMPSYERNRKHALTDHHLAGIFSGIEESLNGTDYRLLIVFNDEHFESRKEYISLFTEHAIDGMLIWGPYYGQRFGTEISQRGYPAVFITPPGHDLDQCNYIIHDYESSGRLALEYTIERGHRKILWAGASRSNAVSEIIEQGFAKVPGEFELISEYGDFSRECGRKIASCSRQKYPEITAIIAANAEVAAGMQDIYDGKNPEIIVCDSVEESNMTDNVRICVDDVTLGRQAVRHLLDMIDNKNCVVQEKLPVKLITAKEVQK